MSTCDHDRYVFHFFTQILISIRSFHEVWNMVSTEDNISSLYQECAGWIARYQIWNVMADDPQLKEEYVIPLDNNEVWLQVQHFLMRSHSREQRAPSKSANRLVLHFPTAIKRIDLSTFVILRTVYTVVREHQQSQNPLISQHTSYVLPLDFNDTLKSIWLRGADLKATVKPSTKYTYGVEFSDCGEYVLYQDIMGMTLVPKGINVATTFAVFRVRDSASWTRTENSSFRLLGYLEPSTPNHYFAGWSFHPTLPVLAVQARSVVEKLSRLMLWNFDCSRSSL